MSDKKYSSYHPFLSYRDDKSVCLGSPPTSKYRYHSSWDDSRTSDNNTHGRSVSATTASSTNYEFRKLKKCWREKPTIPLRMNMTAIIRICKRDGNSFDFENLSGIMNAKEEHRVRTICALYDRSRKRMDEHCRNSSPANEKKSFASAKNPNATVEMNTPNNSMVAKLDTTAIITPSSSKMSHSSNKVIYSDCWASSKIDDENYSDCEKRHSCNKSCSCCSSTSFKRVSDKREHFPIIKNHPTSDLDSSATPGDSPPTEADQSKPETTKSHSSSISEIDIYRPANSEINNLSESEGNRCTDGCEKSVSARSSSDSKELRALDIADKLKSFGFDEEADSIKLKIDESRKKSEADRKRQELIRLIDGLKALGFEKEATDLLSKITQCDHVDK